MRLFLKLFGFALFAAPNTHAIMGSVERKHYGIASGTLASMRVIGQMLSMAIMTVILALLVGPARIGPDNCHLFVQSARIAFAVFAALCALGVLASIARGRAAAEKEA